MNMELEEGSVFNRRQGVSFQPTLTDASRSTSALAEPRVAVLAPEQVRDQAAGAATNEVSGRKDSSYEDQTGNPKDRIVEVCVRNLGPDQSDDPRGKRLHQDHIKPQRPPRAEEAQKEAQTEQYREFQDLVGALVRRVAELGRARRDEEHLHAQARSRDRGEKHDVSAAYWHFQPPQWPPRGCARGQR